MNFDNASNVYFNNKEVSSIVCLDNNKIIYTKTDDVQPIVYNPSFSFNTDGAVTGSDLNPSYEYIIVQRDDTLNDFINSEKLITDTFFNLYDVEIYYCNLSDLQDITDIYYNIGSWKDVYTDFPDLLMYHGSLKDMITINSTSATFVNITLHNFRISGNYTCSVLDSTDKAMYGNERIRTDPFSFRASTLAYPVTIYLYDNYMELLQTKTVEFSGTNPKPK